MNESENESESESRVRMVWPFLGMIIVVVIQASNMAVNKVAMTDGTNKFIIILYGNAISSLVFLPALFILRRSDCPPLTFKLIWSFFFLSLIGFLAQVFSYAGVDYSSPTLGTAMMNLIPAFTFVLAIFLRIERVAWKNSSCRAKIVGTIMSIAGAFVVSFYKGPAILKSTLNYVPPHQLGSIVLTQQSNWVTGGVLFASEAFMISSWYIVQALILKNFPVVFIIMFFFNFFTALISGLFCLMVVTDPNAWTLKLDTGLIAILYSSLVAGVLRNSLATWCVKVIGPVYVSMFKPLGIIVAVVLGVIFLGDPLCLGSLIGALVIVSGFYAVMWGKYKDEKTNEGKGVGSLATSCRKTPLLQSQALAEERI